MDADEPLSDDEIRALFEPLLGTPMAVAVSGGADSMALMHIAQRALDLVPPAVEGMRLPGRPRLIVLTVDHGLRTGSADDAAWVVSRAEASGLPCRVLAWTGDKPTQGIQAAARAARYQLMHEALVEEARPYHNLVRPLLTAHHYEDQAETFLMRLARGSGIDGLSAMQETALIATATMPRWRLWRTTDCPPTAARFSEVAPDRDAEGRRPRLARGSEQRARRFRARARAQGAWHARRSRHHQRTPSRAVRRVSPARDARSCGRRPKRSSRTSTGTTDNSARCRWTRSTSFPKRSPSAS